jgi:hypothetical protein
MKAIAVVAVSALGVLGIVGLAEVTQNRPDVVEAGTTTVVNFDVGTRDYQRGDDAAAQALWAVCSSTVGGEVSTPVATDDGEGGDTYRVTISPAIGEHGRKRLAGCLEDATLDRVVGHVRSISTAA